MGLDLLALELRLCPAWGTGDDFTGSGLTLPLDAFASKADLPGRGRNTAGCCEGGGLRFSFIEQVLEAEPELEGRLLLAATVISL